ncbi:hypothetical protein HMI54_015180 [Coelomomyces lativittatus]|nr:hypothetical protein HMI54_015180 [Coelomomyces lativittatus]
MTVSPLSSSLPTTSSTKKINLTSTTSTPSPSPPSSVSTTMEKKNSNTKKRKFSFSGDVDQRSSPTPRKKRENSMTELKTLEDVSLGNLACTVFVGQLPCTMTLNQVTELVNPFGKVKCIQMLTRSVKIKSQGVKQVFKGCAYVEYTTPSMAYHATQGLHHKLYQNHRVYAMSLNPKVLREPLEKPTEVLFLTNLPFHYPFNVVSQVLHHHHEPKPKFVKTMSSLGYAFALYSSKEDAAQAFHQLNGVECLGRRIRVDFATQKQAVVIKKEKKIKEKGGGRETKKLSCL